MRGDEPKSYLMDVSVRSTFLHSAHDSRKPGDMGGVIVIYCTRNTKLLKRKRDPYGSITTQVAAGARKKKGKRMIDSRYPGPTGEITHALVRAVVFPAARVVPLDAEPAAGGAGHVADVADGADGPVEGQPVPDFADPGGRRHRGWGRRLAARFKGASVNRRIYRFIKKE